MKRESFFIEGDAGPLYITFFPVCREVPERGRILVVPPFADEMNRTRRTCFQLAGELSAHGFSSLLVDLYGTGDSGGEFEDAEWEIWRNDIRRAAKWFESKEGAPLSLIGIRAGGLLAADVAAHTPLSPKCLLLWQPIVTGQEVMAQFLRLRSVRDGESPECIKDLLHSQGRIEIGGYWLTQKLYGDYCSAALCDLTPRSKQVLWLDLDRTSRNQLSAKSRRVVNKWISIGIDVDSRTLSDSAVWAENKIDVAHHLIVESCKWLTSAL